MMTEVEAQLIRAKIRSDVEQIIPLDDLERTHINDVLAWIDSGADLFRIQKPDLPPKHLVSYFVLVDVKQRSILLVDHIKAQLWLPTGGHVFPNEDPKAAVVREADEELRMKATFLHNNDRPFFVTVNTTGGLTPGHDDVSLWYLVKGDVHEFINFDNTEFKDIEWYTFDEILELDPIIFDRHLHRFTRKLAAYIS